MTDNDVQHIRSVTDMELWVQTHGYPRFCQALANGEFKGHTLRLARQWDIDRSDRRKRRLVVVLAVFAVAAGLAAFLFYVAPVLLTAARS